MDKNKPYQDKERYRKIQTYISLNKDHITDYNKIDKSDIFSIFSTSDYNEIIKIINDNSILNFRNDDGLTLIHSIIENSTLINDHKLKIIKELMNKNVSINVMNKYNQNSLHYAAMNKNYTIFKFLIENNGDYKLLDNNGNSPLHYMIDNLIFDCNKNDYYDFNKYNENIKKSSTSYKINQIISQKIINDIFKNIKLPEDSEIPEITNLIKLIENNKFLKKNKIIEIFKNTEEKLNELLKKNNFVNKSLDFNLDEICTNVKNNLLNDIYSNITYNIETTNVFSDKFDENFINTKLNEYAEKIIENLNKIYNDINSDITKLEEGIKQIYTKSYQIPFNFIAKIYYNYEFFKLSKFDDIKYGESVKYIEVNNDIFIDNVAFNLYNYEKNENLNNTLNIEDCNNIDDNNINIIRPFVYEKVFYDYYNITDKDRDNYNKIVINLENKLKNEVNRKLQDILNDANNYKLNDQNIIKFFNDLQFIDSYYYIYINMYLYETFEFINNIKISFLQTYLNSSNPTDFNNIINFNNLDSKMKEVIEIFINFINRCINEYFKNNIGVNRIEENNEIIKDYLNNLYLIKEKIKDKPDLKIKDNTLDIFNNIINISDTIYNINKIINLNAEEDEIYFHFLKILNFYLINNLNIILFQIKNNIIEYINNDIDIDSINPINKVAKNKILPLIEKYKENINKINKSNNLPQPLFTFDDNNFSKFDDISYINLLIIKNICIENYYSVNTIIDLNNLINITQINDESKVYDIIANNFVPYIKREANRDNFNTMVNNIKTFNPIKNLTIQILANLILYGSDLKSNPNLLNYSAKFFLVNFNDISNLFILDSLKDNLNLFTVLISSIYNPIINNKIISSVFDGKLNIIKLRKSYINAIINPINYDKKIILNNNLKDELLKSISFIAYGENPTEIESKKIQELDLELELLKENNPNINGNPAIPYEYLILALSGFILNQVDNSLEDITFDNVEANLKPEIKNAIFSIFDGQYQNDNNHFSRKLFNKLSEVGKRILYNSNDLKLSLTISFIKSSVNRNIIEMFHPNILDYITRITPEQIRVLVDFYKDINLSNIIPDNIDSLIKEKREEYKKAISDNDSKEKDYNKNFETFENTLTNLLKNNYTNKNLFISNIYYDRNKNIINPSEPNDIPELSSIRNGANSIRNYTLTDINVIPHINIISNYDNLVTKAVDNLEDPITTTNSDDYTKAIINPGDNENAINNAYSSAKNIDSNIILPIDYLIKNATTANSVIGGIAAANPAELISSRISSISIAAAANVANCFIPNIPNPPLVFAAIPIQPIIVNQSIIDIRNAITIATNANQNSTTPLRTNIQQVIQNSDSISRFINDALTAIKNKENVVARNSIQNINDELVKLTTAIQEANRNNNIQIRTRIANIGAIPPAGQAAAIAAEQAIPNDVRNINDEILQLQNNNITTTNSIESNIHVDANVIIPIREVIRNSQIIIKSSQEAIRAIDNEINSQNVITSNNAHNAANTALVAINASILDIRNKVNQADLDNRVAVADINPIINGLNLLNAFVIPNAGEIAQIRDHLTINTNIQTTTNNVRIANTSNNDARNALPRLDPHVAAPGIGTSSYVTNAVTFVNTVTTSATTVRNAINTAFTASNNNNVIDFVTQAKIANNAVIAADIAANKAMEEADIAIKAPGIIQPIAVALPVVPIAVVPPPDPVSKNKLNISIRDVAAEIQQAIIEINNIIHGAPGAPVVPVPLVPGVAVGVQYINYFNNTIGLLNNIANNNDRGDITNAANNLIQSINDLDAATNAANVAIAANNAVATISIAPASLKVAENIIKLVDAVINFNAPAVANIGVGVVIGAVIHNPIYEIKNNAITLRDAANAVIAASASMDAANSARTLADNLRTDVNILLRMVPDVQGRARIANNNAENNAGAILATANNLNNNLVTLVGNIISVSTNTSGEIQAINQLALNQANALYNIVNNEVVNIQINVNNIAQDNRYSQVIDNINRSVFARKNAVKYSALPTICAGAITAAITAAIINYQPQNANAIQNINNIPGVNLPVNLGIITNVPVPNPFDANLDGIRIAISGFNNPPDANAFINNIAIVVGHNNGINPNLNIDPNVFGNIILLANTLGNLSISPNDFAAVASNLGDGLLDATIGYINIIAHAFPENQRNSIYTAVVNSIVLISSCSEKILSKIQESNKIAYESTKNFFDKINESSNKIIDDIINTLQISKKNGDEFIKDTIIAAKNKLNFIVKNNLNIIDKYYLVPIDKKNKSKNNNKDNNQLSDKFNELINNYLKKFDEYIKSENKKKDSKNTYESYVKMVDLLENRKDNLNEFYKLCCNTVLLKYYITHKDNINSIADENSNKVYSIYMSESSFKIEFIPDKNYANSIVHSCLIYIYKEIKLIKENYITLLDNKKNNIQLNKAFIACNIIYEKMLNILNNLCILYEYLNNIKIKDFYQPNILDKLDNKEKIELEIYIKYINATEFKSILDDIYSLIKNNIFEKLNNIIEENNKYQHIKKNENKPFYSNNINFNNFYKNMPDTLEEYYNILKIDMTKFIPYYNCYDENIIYNYIKNENGINYNLWRLNIDNNEILSNSAEVQLNVDVNYKPGFQQFLFEFTQDRLELNEPDNKINEYLCENKQYNYVTKMVVFKTGDVNPPEIIVNSLYIFEMLIEQYILNIYTKYKDKFKIDVILGDASFTIQKENLSEKEKELLVNTIGEIKKNEIKQKNTIYENIIKIIKSYIESQKEIEIYNLLKTLFKDESKIKQLLDKPDLNKIINETLLKSFTIEEEKENRILKNNRIIDKCYKQSDLEDFAKLKRKKDIDLRIKDYDGNTILNRFVNQFNLAGFTTILIELPTLWTYKNSNNQNCEQYIDNMINIIKEEYKVDNTKNDKIDNIKSKFKGYTLNIQNMIRNDNDYKIMSFDDTEYEIVNDIFNNCIIKFSNYIYTKCNTFNLNYLTNDDCIKDLFNIDYTKVDEYVGLFKNVIEKIFNDYNDLDKYEDTSYNETNYEMIEILKNNVIISNDDKNNISKKIKDLIFKKYGKDITIDFISNILKISMINKLELQNPDTQLQNIESLENQLIDNILEKNNIEVEKIELKEIINFYKLITDSISLYTFNLFKEILKDLKKISILIQMKEIIKNYK